MMNKFKILNKCFNTENFNEGQLFFFNIKNLKKEELVFFEVNLFPLLPYSTEISIINKKKLN